MTRWPGFRTFGFFADASDGPSAAISAVATRSPPSGFFADAGDGPSAAISAVPTRSTPATAFLPILIHSSKAGTNIRYRNPRDSGYSELQAVPVGRHGGGRPAVVEARGGPGAVRG